MHEAGDFGDHVPEYHDVEAWCRRTAEVVLLVSVLTTDLWRRESPSM
jgi:hypothetical protein